MQFAISRANTISNSARNTLLLLVLTLMVVAGYLLYTNRQLEDRYAKDIKQVEQSASQKNNEQIKSIEEIVSKSIGTDDSWGSPSVSRVVDAEKLKKEDAAFFADVQNGDWLVVYTLKKKVVVYRSETNLIIRYGDLI